MIRYFYLDVNKRRYYESSRALLEARRDRKTTMHALAQPPRDSLVLAGDPCSYTVQDGVDLHAELGGRNSENEASP